MHNRYPTYIALERKLSLASSLASSLALCLRMLTPRYLPPPDKKISPRSVDGDNAYCLNSLDSVNSEKYLDKERLASCSAYNSKESLTDSQDNNCKSKFSTISSNNCFGTIYEDNSSVGD